MRKFVGICLVSFYSVAIFSMSHISTVSLGTAISKMNKSEAIPMKRSSELIQKSDRCIRPEKDLKSPSQAITPSDYWTWNIQSSSAQSCSPSPSDYSSLK